MLAMIRIHFSKYEYKKGDEPMKIDIIGDIHGCYQELIQLLELLGYNKEQRTYTHPDGRILAFIGDLTDRGPNSVDVIRLAASLVHAKKAYYVPGNHCDKLYRYFLGRKVQIKNGLETTVAELKKLNHKEFSKVKKGFMNLVESSPYYQRLDDGRLVIAHAGIRSEDVGQMNDRIKSFVLYGDTTGETNSDGSHVRLDWAKHNTGRELIVYGHTPVLKPRFINNTVNIDTGCVFGGHLTALRYPEMETVQVRSMQPFIPEKFRTFS